MAERLFDLPETKGAFQLRGLVSGTSADRFYNENKTKTGKEMRSVNFGINYNYDNKLFLNILGIENDFVFFYSKDDKKTEKVAWGDRHIFNKEGYRLIGTNVGVKKKVDEKGNLVNDSRVMTDYDACEEILKNLKDGQSLFTRGSLNFRSYVNKNGDKVSSINLTPNQLSLCADVDFTDEEYVETNFFNQVIVYTGIDKEKDDNGKDTGRFVVSAKIVTYSTIEDAEFIIVDNKLANLFRKNLKPYYALQVSGKMVAEPIVEEVSDEDEWGEHDAMERVSAPVKREFIITGAKPSTIEKELYNETKISEAILAIERSKKAENDFGSDTSDWGEVEDDEDEAW